jgi:hypothetical protein
MDDAQNSPQQSQGVGFSRKPARAVLLCSAILVLCTLAAKPAGQQQNPNGLSSLPRSPRDGFNDPDPAEAARQLRALNEERQKAIVSDTNKLVKLAQELNQELNSEVETGNQQKLTHVELRKITDIEKLARNVRQKMSISFESSPFLNGPAPQQSR